MTDDHAGLHLRRKIDRALRVTDPLLVLLRTARRWLEKIRRRLHDSGRQRTKIMGRPYLDDTLFNGPKNSGDERNPDAVT